MKLRKTIALLLCAMTVIGLFAGCNKSETPDTSADKQTTTTSPSTTTPAPSSTAPATTDAAEYKEEVVIGLAEEFNCMDPMNTSGSLNQLIQNLVYGQIAGAVDENIPNGPMLAESMNMIEADLWEVKLLQNVNFTDGTVMNADDVLFTCERALTSDYCSWRADIAEVTKVDDFTVRFKLVAPNVDFNYKLATDSFAILSKEAFESMPEEEAVKVGNGPWKWEEYVPGEYVSLVRNEDSTYYDTPNTKRLVFKMIPEASSRLVALQTGEIDICMEPSAVDYQTVLDDDNLQLLQVATRGTRYIAFNCDSDCPFGKPLVRKAVASAIVRSDIITVATGGFGAPSNNVCPTSSDYYTEIEGIPEDLEKAKEYLTEAGYPDGFSTTLIYQADSERSDIATVVQAQLAKIGITVELQGVEAAAFKELVTEGRTHDFCIGRWSPGASADNAYRNVFKTEGSAAFCNLNDPEIDAMIDAAAYETDSAKRAEMYKELQVNLTEETVAWVPLYMQVATMAAKADVEGLQLMPSGAHRFHWVQIPMA